MPDATTTPAPFEFSLQFARGIGEVDPQKGILRGVTVAEVGEARGWFCFLNPAGSVLGVGAWGDLVDYPPQTRRLQLAMDGRSLQTVVEAAKKTPRVRTREDHDDGIGARAGYAENFRMEDGRVVCDQTIFASYRNRAVLFETAAMTPELIGLSGEFLFNAEVAGDRALMRVTKVDAVDIVDQGALTHAGLFSVKKARAVDSTEKGKAELFSSMSSKTPCPVDLKALRKTLDELAAYRSANSESNAEIDAALAGFGQTAPAAGAAGAAPAAGATEGAVSASALKAMFATQLEQVTAAATNAVKAEHVEFRKQMTALGLSAGAGPGAAAAGAAAGGAAAGAAPAETFLTMRARIAAERKMKLSEADHVVIRERPDLYNEFQIAAGVMKRN